MDDRCNRCPYISKTFKVECPHCGMEQNVMVDIRAQGNVALNYCDVEFGGCDQTFIVKWEPVPYRVVVGTFREVERE